MNIPDSITDGSKSVLSRIERNRQKALAIRHSKLLFHPYGGERSEVSINKTIKIGTINYKDTGGGFLLQEKTQNDVSDDESLSKIEAPVLESDRPNCNKCDKPIASSWLLDNFTFKCCDSCRDTEEEHKLITKTEALNKYLLKDHDLEKRDPPLKFITKKNPHNVHWGDMKLYLELQVADRALEVWGSNANIETEREHREEKKVVAKAKKYHKQLKELKMSIRSSLYDRTSVAHVHEFEAEKYIPEEDNYTRRCLTCSYVETFEKM